MCSAALDAPIVSQTVAQDFDHAGRGSTEVASDGDLGAKNFVKMKGLAKTLCANVDYLFWIPTDPSATGKITFSQGVSVDGDDSCSTPRARAIHSHSCQSGGTQPGQNKQIKMELVSDTVTFQRPGEGIAKLSWAQLKSMFNGSVPPSSISFHAPVYLDDVYPRGVTVTFASGPIAGTYTSPFDPMPGPPHAVAPAPELDEDRVEGIESLKTALNSLLDVAGSLLV